ncbi:hypothetical protein BWQ96_07097 [Gracilariopsis chorda]|uniref:Uncharacterized protein n=1 Tax=Gracilariopsis chorda TaxID=448386 RepID=A0A2V3IM60_9FLOR|nr:hypothetical protein BWQ96_07097 [Gracilariopsis chorda]|eukprot:PXF43153.1 hypothetical protein BWQ96_07097 [Gracilariopsis chorda]
MQEPTHLIHKSPLRVTFLPLFPPRSSIIANSTPLQPLKRHRTRHSVARRRRVRSAAETPDPSPEPSGQDASGASSEDESEQIDIEDIKLQFPLPSIFENSGNPECEQCAGAGEIECPVCSGTGFYSLTMMDTVSSSQCRMCQGHKSIPCPTCRRVVYKSVLWWDQVPSAEDDPEEKWRDGEEGPRFQWGENPAD